MTSRSLQSIGEPPAPPDRGGVLGAVGLAPDHEGQVAAWIEGRGAQSIGADDGCRLWCLGRPFGGLRRFEARTVWGYCLGDAQPPGPHDANIADVVQRLGTQAGFALRGQFAMLLRDPATNSVALFRDGSSAQSLYYARPRARPPGSTTTGADGGPATDDRPPRQAPSERGLLFSDRLDLLADCPLVGARIDPPGLHEYLRLLDISPPRTIYAGITALEPEQLVTWTPIGPRVTGRPTPLPPATAPTGLAAATDALEQALLAAVAERLPATGDVVVFLSGGVDSACLCALAADLAPGRVVAVTVGFDDPGADESALATGIATHLGVRHALLRFNLDSYRAAFDALAVQADYPFADPAGAPTLLAFRHAVGLADVALDGTGADTLLGIMPARHQRMAVGWAAQLPRPLRAGLARALGTLPWARDYRPILDFGDPEEVLMRWRGFPRQAIAELVGAPVDLSGSRFYWLFRSFPRHAHFERYSALMGNLPDDRLHVAAHLTGLRVRFPFFDPGVVGLVRGLPRDLRWRRDEPKRVLKAALARRLPKSLWDVPKHGFDFPFVALLEHRDHALVRQWLDPARIRASGLLDPTVVADLTDAFIAGDHQHAFRVWALVVLFAWLAHHRH